MVFIQAIFRIVFKFKMIDPPILGGNRNPGNQDFRSEVESFIHHQLISHCSQNDQHPIFNVFDVANLDIILTCVAPGQINRRSKIDHLSRSLANLGENVLDVIALDTTYNSVEQLPK